MLIDGYERYDGFGLNGSTLFDCGAAALPLVSSRMDNVAEVTSEAVKNAPSATTFLDDATAPVGRRGNLIDIAPGTNSRATIGGCEYSDHALDRMQGQGITPSVVEDALTTSNSVTGKVPGSTA